MNSTKRNYKIKHLPYLMRVSESVYLMHIGVTISLIFYFVDVYSNGFLNTNFLYLMGASFFLIMSFAFLEPSNKHLDEEMVDIGVLNEIKEWVNEFPELTNTINTYLINNNDISKYGLKMIRDKYYELVDLKNEQEKRTLLNEISTNKTTE